MCKLYNSLCIYVATISLLSILLGSSSFDWPGAVSASCWCLTPCEGCIYLFVLARANVRGVFYGVFWHCHNYSRCGRESQPTKKTFHIHIHMHIYGSTITSSCLFLVGRTLHEACASPVDLFNEYSSAAFRLDDSFRPSSVPSSWGVVCIGLA